MLFSKLPGYSSTGLSVIWLIASSMTGVGGERERETLHGGSSSLGWNIVPYKRPTGTI